MAIDSTETQPEPQPETQTETQLQTDTQVLAAAAQVTYYTTAPVTLNVRSGPGTGYSIVRTLPGSSRVPIVCQRPGTTVSGTYGTSNIWDNIASGQYISDAYVKTGSDGYVAARCS
ncbi:hypothetical protein ACFV6E_23690 [Streptomyces sp. NPDC059785]|uniref:hypothetical protein n=1 Tax=unclassified Streptomyces TaxID=2593676 RepID=UPI00365815D2